MNAQSDLVRCRRLLRLACQAAVLLGIGCGSAAPPVRQPLPVSTEAPPPEPTPTLPPPAPAAIAPRMLDPSSQRLAGEIEAFEAADRVNPPAPGSTLFIGSSSFRQWQSLEREFADYQALNRGFGGSSMRNVFDYADRIVIPYRPKRIIVFAGSNDIHAGVLPFQIRADFEAFVKLVWATLPGTPIAYVSITASPSRYSEVEQVKAANRQIEAYVATDPRLAFIDVFSKTVGRDGTPLAELYGSDGLHPNEKGYAIWSKLLREYLNAQNGGATPKSGAAHLQ